MSIALSDEWPITFGLSEIPSNTCEEILNRLPNVRISGVLAQRNQWILSERPVGI